MKEIDDPARKWLAEHSDQIGPEELISEDAKQKLFDGSWPFPQEVADLGMFADIKDATSFNDIVSNPDNWYDILNRADLFEKWILPHAALYFGKLWFDRVKRRNSISKGVPFPLFTKEERKCDIENSPQGRAKIAKIVEKISIVLRTYLEGKWYDGNIKKPSGYIINSLKNEFVKEVGSDMGYKFRNVPACPYCLTSKPVFKVPLLSHQHGSYSCHRCKSYVDNLELQIESLKKKDDRAELIKVQVAQQTRKKFEKFIGITCVCPSNDCSGHFVPFSCIDRCRLDNKIYKGALKGISVGKNIQNFRLPPEILLDFPLTCPYCGTKFTPREALQKASGFKEKSGFLTGLPSIRIWMKMESAVLDLHRADMSSSDSFKDQLAVPPASDDYIATKQRLNLLINEIIIHMSKVIKSTTSGLTTWYFLAGVIHWMAKHSHDANNYLFNWKVVEREMTKLEMIKYPGRTKKKVTKNTRGQEIAVHQAIFHEWMDLLESNIEEFTKIDLKIKALKNFGWFSRCPRFSGGPETTFYSEVDGRNRIVNKTPIRRRRSKKMPRLARVYSIRKDGENFTDNMEISEWQAIRLKPNSDLKAGDKVFVEALIMSGHPTHAPIQRILRLRSSLLKNIIDRILTEERTGHTDQMFWQTWKMRVARARKETGITVSL